MTCFRKEAFTLVELIVSLALTAVIAFFVFSFAANLANLWRNTETGVDTELDAQIVLDQIAMDLESAVFQERRSSAGDPVSMFAVSAISKSDLLPQNASRWNRWLGVADSARPESYHFDPASNRYGWAGAWLRFFTAAPSFNAVGYHVARRRAFDNTTSLPKYLLHRAVVDHDETLAGGFDIVNGTFDYGDEPNKTEDVLARPHLNSAILEDVVDFGVRLYIFDQTAPATPFTPDGLRLIFPVLNGGAFDEDIEEHFGSALDGTVYSSRYPEVVEVYLRVLDDVGADLLIRLEQGEAVASYEEILEKHSRLYRRMVRLPGREPKGYVE